MMINRNLQMLISLFVILAGGSMAWSLAPVPSRAQSLLRERDQLQQQLLQADQSASSALLQGEDPVEWYAEQTGLQEQVDMMQMRLESLAMRLDFDIPPLSHSIQVFDPQHVLDQHVATGRKRAMDAMNRRCETACGLIVGDMNFNSFLDF